MHHEMMIPCDACGGEGLDMDTATRPCPACQGRGDAPCHKCQGKACARCGDGYLADRPCGACDGSGEVEYHPRCKACQATGWVPNPKAFVRDPKALVPRKPRKI